MALDVAKIEEYVRKKYPKTFKGKEITLITENQSFYLVKTNKDASPLILNKNVE
tara:strand:+ start:135 stop:296 length:162 start_codon:yes stop_codon:yes gene_type:complete